jgi:hypothetical protein
MTAPPDKSGGFHLFNPYFYLADKSGGFHLFNPYFYLADKSGVNMGDSIYLIFSSCLIIYISRESGDFSLQSFIIILRIRF